MRFNTIFSVFINVVLVHVTIDELGFIFTSLFTLPLNTVLLALARNMTTLATERKRKFELSQDYSYECESHTPLAISNL